MITKGNGKHQVHLEIKEIGDHLLFVLTGGEQPHLGGMVVCESGKEPVVIRLGSHKDYVVLKPLAQTACEKYKTTVAAVGGIHIDDATEKDIETIVQNCKRIESCI